MTSESSPAPDRADERAAARLRAGLARAGAQIEVEPGGDLAVVEQAAGRLIRRRRTIVGLLGVGVVACGALVITVLNDDDPGSVASTSDARPVDDRADSDPEPDTGPGDVASTTDAPVAAGPDTDAASAEGDDGDAEPAAGDGTITAVDGAAGGAAGGSMVGAERVSIDADDDVAAGTSFVVLPWGDGFLRLRTSWPDPSEPGAPFEETVHVSDDGSSWTELDVALPASTWAGQRVLAVDGHRLANLSIVTSPPDDPSDPLSLLGYDSTPDSVSIEWTQDLQTWSSDDVPVPTGIDPVRPFLVERIEPAGMAISGDRWVVMFNRSLAFDYASALANAFAARPELSSGGWSQSLREDGVVLTVFEFGGEVSEEIVVGWDELGVEPLLEYDGARYDATFAVTGAFGGAVADPVRVPGFGQIRGVDDGFVRLGAPRLVSPDGLQWTEVSWDGAERILTGIHVEHEGTITAFGADGLGQPLEANELDMDTAVLRPADGPSLPFESSTVSPSSLVSASSTIDAAVLYQLPVEIEPQPVEVSEGRGWIEPEVRLLATDGERWIDVMVAEGGSLRIDDPREWDVWVPPSVAVNGDVVVVAFADGSVERFEF